MIFELAVKDWLEFPDFVDVAGNPIEGLTSMVVAAVEPDPEHEPGAPAINVNVYIEVTSVRQSSSTQIPLGRKAPVVKRGVWVFDTRFTVNFSGIDQYQGSVRNDLTRRISSLATSEAIDAINEKHGSRITEITQIDPGPEYTGFSDGSQEKTAFLLFRCTTARDPRERSAPK